MKTKEKGGIKSASLKRWKASKLFSESLKKSLEFIKKNHRIILLSFFTFAALSAINFYYAATGESVDNYNMENYEVGQIAERTITARKSLPPSAEYPLYVEKGEKITKRGFPITEEAYKKLEKIASSPAYVDTRALLNKELCLILLFALHFLFYSGNEIGTKKRKLREWIFRSVSFLSFYTVATLSEKVKFFSDEYALLALLPSSLFILLDSILYGQKSAVNFSLILSFSVFFAKSFQALPFMFTLFSSLVTAEIVKKVERRIDLAIISLVLAIINSLLLMILAVIFQTEISKIIFPVMLVALNGFLSGILALGIITPLEFLLNTDSVFRLMDLSDLNSPLMRKMLVMASGTYQHSQLVAQLAENAARKIGANPLIARVGAYYHDIGKIEQSEYFTENQVNGINKHDELTPKLSAAIIRSHVKKGIEKARELHMPECVIKIIGEHHGNGVISYFYNKAKEMDENVDIKDFSHTGVPPSFKESAVVMLADTVEAACRSLSNPTKENIQIFMENLIKAKLEAGQLDNSDLSFKDLALIKEEFLKILVSFYHNRVRYPNQKEMESKSTQEENNEK